MSTGGRGDKEVGGTAGTQKRQEGHGSGWERGGTATRRWGESQEDYSLLLPKPAYFPVIPVAAP